ncbi:MAG: hypothetical protein LBE18_08385 [Planctomycetaceae bacterium]|nr:hypothetical protein [Planctomycetaceae bacterium]
MKFIIYNLIIFFSLIFIFFDYNKNYFDICQFVFAENNDNLLVNETFEKDLHGWLAERSARIYTNDNMLRIDTLKTNSAENDPVISKSYNVVGSQIRLIIEIQTLTTSDLVVNWTTKESPTRDDNKKIIQKLNPDGEWHKIGFFLPVDDMLETVSIRFTSTSGMWAIRSISLYGHRTHPIRLQKISQFRQKNPDGTERDMLRYSIRNNAPFAIKFLVEQPQGVDEQMVTLSRNQTIDFGVPIKKNGNLAAVKLVLRTNDPAISDWFPRTVFPAFLYDPQPETNWITTKLGKYIFEISPDARIARISQNNEVVAIIAPIAHHNGIIPDFKQKKEPEIINATNIINVTKNNQHNIRHNISAAADNVYSEKTQISFSSPAADLDISIINETIKFKIISKQNIQDKKSSNETIIEPLEGPVVRLLGKLNSGLLPGIEFLESGDISSSAIDIKPPYNYRGKPNPIWLTMQMATLATDKIAATLTWNNTTLQPAFHSPNMVDYTSDHRMSLIGTVIDAELQILPTIDLKSKESAAIRSLRNYLKNRELPDPPQSPRNSSEQLKLCLTGIRGAIQSADGAAWGYATDPAWKRRPYADMISTIARLTTRTPQIKEIESGGADIANDAIYFLTENIEQWKTTRENSIKSITALRNPDGSYLFRSRFPEVESAATSYGLTAIRVLEIMEYVRYTGNKQLFESVKESLEFLIKCEVPRGGFYQDSPLHTPDILTAATLTWLFVWAYEYSNEQRYLEAANRFAISGLPFVYQWSNRDTMLYVTIPKLGGNSRGTPLWFGVSQPRTGIIYAYALAILSIYDKSIDWLKIATGILHATEKMQFTNGNNIGCLPDMFNIDSQHGSTTGINPVAIAILRLTIEQKPGTLFILIDHGDRYVSPFPLKTTKRGIEAANVPPEQFFQILCNGGRIINARGNGLITID